MTRLRVKAAAEYCGVSVDRMYKLANSGDIPTFRATDERTSRYEFEPADLDEWIKSRTKRRGETKSESEPVRPPAVPMVYGGVRNDRGNRHVEKVS